MTLQELRYLVTLADLGHFGQAAEACHVTQSTLSTQLKKLEGFLGVTLFDRSLKRIVPTPIGREIVLAARRVIEETDRIRELVRHAQNPMARTLHLGVIPTLGPYYLPHALTVLHKAYPDLRLLLREEVTPHILGHLNEGRLDAALLALPVEGEGINSEALFFEPFMAAFPAGHVSLKKRNLRVNDLDSERMLLLEEGHCLRGQMLEVCGRGKGMTEEVRATSLETLRQMVSTGLGVTLLPALAAGEAAPPAMKKSVEVRPFRAPAPGRVIGLVWRKRAPLQETFARLADTLRNSLPKGVSKAA